MTEPSPPEKSLPRPRCTLALSGGAAMGLAHIGVIEVLRAQGIGISAMAGTSMGAVVAAFHAAGKLDVLKEWALGLGRHWWLRHIDPVFSRSGMMAGGRITRLLERHLGAVRIEDLPLPFAAVAVDLRHGRPVSMTRGSLVEAVRASIAVPGLLAGVERDGAFLVDGVLLDPVPVREARRLNADPVVAVNLYADPQGTALHAGLIEQDPATGRRGRNRPRPDKIAAAGHMVMIRRIAEAEAELSPPDLAITPQVAHLGLPSYHRAADFIAEGRRSAEAALAGPNGRRITEAV